MSIYTIDTTLRSEGTEHHVDYYPSGYGYTYPGYVTSLSQYLDELRKHLTSSKVSLYTISQTGSSSTIDDEYDLRRAVSDLPNGRELAVTAIKESNPELEPPGPYQENVSDVMERFDVPSSKYCHHNCGKITSGLRYYWHSSTQYYLCSDCYEELSQSDRRDWKRGNSCGTPWELDAPQATLQEEYGLPVLDEVCHLQYLLTRLGFMPLNATDGLVGSYRTNTGKAVELFRRKYYIYDDDMTVYDSHTAHRLLHVVNDFRSSGAQFI